MITWIQKTFQQHFRIVFIVLLAVVVISFVFVFNASSGLGRNNQATASAKRPFFGVDINAGHDAIMRDGSLSVILQRGGLPQDAQLQQAAYSRIALLHLADQMRLPTPTQADQRSYIMQLPIFANPQTGQFDNDRYNYFLQNPSIFNQTGYNITPSDFTRILREDTRIAIAGQLLSGPGYALPADIQQTLSQATTTWTLQTATIDRDSFKPAITPTDAQITQQFETNRDRYIIPPRIRVNFAEIPNSAFADAIVLSGTDVRAFYDANPARFPKPANTAPAALAAASTPDTDFLLVRPQVETALRQQLAARAAYKAASDLSYKLYSAKVVLDSPEFTRLLEQNHATLNTARDFAMTPTPAASDIPAPLSANAATVVKEAAALDGTNRISNAITTGTSAVILFWQDGIPARQPTLDEVREKVAADIIAQEKQRLFTALGQTLQTQIQAAVKTGTPFEQAVTAAAAGNNVTATTQTLAPFTLRTAPQDLPPYIFPALDNLAQGAVSNMITLDNTGHLIYAKTVQIPDLTEANPAYADAARRISISNARATAGSYIQSLVDAELAKSTPAGAARE